MGSKSKVYIIILNYNGWADTIECLESVLRNDYPNYQVIVVDNNSPNNSIEYIKAWAEGKLNVWVKPDHPLRCLSFPPVKKPIPYVYYTKEEAEKGGNPELEKELQKMLPKDLFLTLQYPLIFIQTGKNLGFAGGNNVGIKYVLAKDVFDSVILLNNDTVIQENTISEIIKAKSCFGDKAIYGGRIYYYKDPNRIWYDGGHFNEWLGRTVHINMGKLKSEVKKMEDIRKVNFITFCYVLIPKIVLKNIGLLDESFFMYVEDLDYSYRVWKNGYKLYHISSSQIWHKCGASSGEEISQFSAYWYYRNSLKFRIKKLDGIKRYIAIFFYFVRLPLLFLKWLIVRREIISSLLKGLKDGIV